MIIRKEVKRISEVGKALISVEGNPLEDIRALDQVRLVMKAGERYDTLSPI